MQTAIDAKTGAKIECLAGGLEGFVSWRRLAEVFREGNEIRPSEELVSYRLTSEGIHYRVKSR